MLTMFNKKENLIIIFIAFSCSALYALHSFCLVSQLQGALNHAGININEYSVFVERYLNILQGQESSDPLNSRIFVPILIKFTKFIMPKSFIHDQYILFIIQISSALFAVFMFLEYSRSTINNINYIIISVLAFMVACISSAKDIGLMGDLFRVGFFLGGLILIDKVAKPNSFKIKPFSLLLWIIFFIFGASCRLDIVMLIGFIGLLIGIYNKNVKLIVLSIIAWIISLSIFFLITKYFNVHDLLYATFFSSPGGPLRITQLTSLGSWLLLLFLFNILLIIPFILWKRMKGNDKIIFLSTLLYSLFLLFVANVGEYRLFMPLLSILILWATLYLETTLLKA